MLDYLFDINTYIILINIISFLLFALDKAKAKTKGFRIPEIVLLLSSLFFGGVGAVLGMILFNHKTSKMLFRIIVPFSFVLNYVLSYDSFAIMKRILSYILQIIPE